MNGLGHSISPHQVEEIIKMYYRPTSKLNLSDEQQLSRLLDYAINNQNMQSSPGFPYNQTHATTKEMIFYAEDRLRAMVLERINLLRTDDITGLTAEEIVQGGFADPIKLFVKNEPHRASKISSGRVRVIFSVSIVDRIVQMIMCQLQNSWEIDNWEHIPSKSGFGFTPDKVSRFVKSLSGYPSHQPSDYTASDVQSWDWNVTEDDFAFEAYVRWSLEDSNPDDLDFYRNVYYAASRKLVVLSDGRALAQQFPGIMPSGAYFTTPSNSRIRVKVGMESGSSPRSMSVMGDDSIEHGVIDLRNASRNFKGIQQFEDAVEFCSHLIYFGPGVEPHAEPINVKKMLYKLYSSVNVEEELFLEKLYGVKQVLQNRSDYSSIVRRIGPLPYSQLF